MIVIICIIQVHAIISLTLYFNICLTKPYIWQIRYHVFHSRDHVCTHHCLFDNISIHIWQNRYHMFHGPYRVCTCHYFYFTLHKCISLYTRPCMFDIINLMTYLSWHIRHYIFIFHYISDIIYIDISLCIGRCKFLLHKALHILLSMFSTILKMCELVILICIHIHISVYTYLLDDRHGRHQHVCIYVYMYTQIYMYLYVCIYIYI